MFLGFRTVKCALGSREAPRFLACFSKSLEGPCSLGEAEGRALSAEGTAGTKAQRRGWPTGVAMSLGSSYLLNVGCRKEIVRYQGPKGKLIACEGSMRWMVVN